MARKPGQVYATDLPDAAVSFDIEQFDNAIRSHGVTFVHWRAMRCPVGMIDENDSRRPHEDHSGCSNGFLYTRAGEITCLFSGNSSQPQFSELGVLDSSTVTITLPPRYDDNGEPLYIAPFDRLYLKEESIVVPDWQLFRSTGSLDKLRFIAVTVQDLVDAGNNRYDGQDFSVDQGSIRWIGSRRPAVDPITGQGSVCSVRFTYRPYWYVKSMIHEVRVSQAEDPVTGERRIFRMPQSAQLQREFVFEKNSRDELAPDQARQVKAPDHLNLGPR